MKKLLLAVFSITATFSLYAQREVPQERMEPVSYTHLDVYKRQ